MSEHGGGGDGGPVFIDVYGTSKRLGLELSNKDNGSHGFEGPHPDGPFWLRTLKGEVPLWVVFWGGFFCGHGIVLALSVAVMLVGVIMGISMDPERNAESLIAAKVIIGVMGTLMTVFGTWAVISVWRCAKHAEKPKWAIAARSIVVTYVCVWSFAIWEILA